MGANRLDNRAKVKDADRKMAQSHAWDSESGRP